MLDPIQNHALRLCLGTYRTSPASSLSVLANEPPFYLRCKKLSMQYSLKLSSNSENPAHKGVFTTKFKSYFDRQPNRDFRGPIFKSGGAVPTVRPLEKFFCTRGEYFTMSNGVFNFNFLALVFSEILGGPKFTVGGPTHPGHPLAANFF